MRLACGALLWAALVVGCGDGDPRESARAAPAEEPSEPKPAPREGPPHALWDVVDEVREDLARERHPSDGGGRAWLESGDAEPPVARVSSPGRFVVVYEAGQHGIASGGSISFQVSPFWGWSTPQVERPDYPGYTLVEPSAPDLELEPETLDEQLLGIRVAGRAIEPGERVRIVYGAGELGAIADRYAEANSRFWIAVDGDGDGVRAFLPGSPGVVVEPGPPALLLLTLPTIARPGERVPVTLAVLDARGNTGVPFEGEVVFEEIPEDVELEARVAFTPDHEGRRTVSAVVGAEGTIRLRATGPGGLEAESNPLVVTPAGPRVLWGDLHGHSALSDGTGTPEDYFRYARDVAGLDVAALTDHDHWGVLPLHRHPELWDRIREQVRRFHEPGRFVTLLGYEWTSWIHGHRHVLYFDDEGEVLSWTDPDTESPRQLWEALGDRPALTFAHHSAGGPIAVNWDVPPDPHFEPVTEIVSVHGSSEALDAPASIYDPVPGNFVRDVLDRGYRFGFIGSGDSHDGHPGLAHLGAPSGGLAAIIAEERTREAVEEALRARRVYATNGPRILLRLALGAHPMGSVVPMPSEPELLFLHVVAAAPLEHVDLILSGEVLELDAEGRREVALDLPLSELREGDYLYLRAVQEDGGAAWSSPIYIGAE